MKDLIKSELTKAHHNLVWISIIAFLIVVTLLLADYLYRIQVNT